MVIFPAVQPSEMWLFDVTLGKENRSIHCIETGHKSRGRWVFLQFQTFFLLLADRDSVLLQICDVASHPKDLKASQRSGPRFHFLWAQKRYGLLAVPAAGGLANATIAARPTARGSQEVYTQCAKRNALWFTVLCLVGVCDAATSVILHSCMFIQHFGEAVPFLISTRHTILKRCESVCVFYRRYQVVYSPDRYGSQGAWV